MDAVPDIFTAVLLGMTVLVMLAHGLRAASTCAMAGFLAPTVGSARVEVSIGYDVRLVPHRATTRTLNATMTTRAKAIAIPRVEDGRLIATEWRMAPGSETGWHLHGHDYAVVYLTSGELLVETKDGPLTASLERGQVTSREAGVEHNVINVNDFDFVFVELELKRRGE